MQQWKQFQISHLMVKHTFMIDSTNKSDRHDKTDIFLKVALNTTTYSSLFKCQNI